MQARGARLSVSSTEAAAPRRVTPRSAASLDPSQNSVGADQTTLRRPSASRPSSRYSPAGRMPRGPLSPVIWKASDQKADRKISPRARSHSHRGQNTSARIEVVEGDGKALAHGHGDSVQEQR